MPQNDQRKWIRNAGLASSIGLVLVVSTFIGYGLGYLLTHYLHAPDWVALICLLFGIVAGFVEMIRMAIQITKDQD